MLAAAVTLYPPWQRRGFNKWGPREVTTFISGDTPDSIANLVTPPQRHYQSVYRTLPHALRAHAVCCVATCFSLRIAHVHTRARATCPSPLPEVFPRRWNNNASARRGQFPSIGTILYLSDRNVCRNSRINKRVESKSPKVRHVTPGSDKSREESHLVRISRQRSTINFNSI